jgi:pimeloyl-ACP methyl ester carboxylesterase
METASINGAELEYEIAGSGEPVILIHGAFIADTFRPLLVEPSLASGYRLILYHRRGYGGSSHDSGPLSIAQESADCQGLLRHLDVERAHLVGHSYGGVVALQLALDAPELARSLALLEPALAVGASAPGYRESLVRGGQRYREVGAQVVLDEFLHARWPGYSAVIDEVLPGALAQAVADAGMSFERELPALLSWHFGEEEARRIVQPVLSVLGGESGTLSPRFGETHQFLLNSLPHAEEFVLPGATHFLQVEDPRGIAEALSSFWTRHPLAN